MQTTENLGLQYVTENEESTTKVRDYRRSTSSNFQIIDTVIAEALQKITDNEDNIKSLDEAIAELQKRGIYLCSNDETSTLEDGTNVPNIKTPDSSVIYLVSSGDAAPNMWLEYIWVNQAWEQWGSTTIDLTGYATEAFVGEYVSDALQNYATHDDVADSVAQNYWTGKRAMFFGTSITWYCMDGRTFETNGYPQIVAEQLGLNFNTVTDVIGMTGMAMADSKNGDGIHSGITANDTADADLVCIECTTNDFKLNVPLGDIGKIGDTSFNTSTFCGALRLSIETILTRNPDGHILLITDTQRDNDSYDVNYQNSAGCRMEDYVNALISIANMYGIPVCDWYHKSGINDFNLSSYTSDGLHLNAAGYARVGMLTAHTLLDLGAATPVCGGSSLPNDGTEGQVLTKTADGEAWQDPTEIPTKLSAFENDSGFITRYTETDPTVPDWAKSETKPTYTASEVGAAATTHYHAATDITSGTLSVARGGTGRSTLTSGYVLRGNGTGAVTLTSISSLKSLLGTDYVTGTYTGDASGSSTTAQTITLGFQPSVVIAWAPVLSSGVWWYYYDDTDDAGDRVRSVEIWGAFATDDYPAYDYDDVAIMTVTSTGFEVKNNEYNYENSSGTSVREYYGYMNELNTVYTYIAWR